MSTFQSTSKKKEASSDVFQATSRRSYDTTLIYRWEQANRQSLDILNDYNNRINKSEWLDEEDRKKYRSALDSYIETANLLRGINKTFGEGYSDEDEKKWADSIASMNEDYDGISGFYGQFADERTYKQQYLKPKEYNSTLSAEDFGEYSQAGAGVANPDWNKAHAPVDIFGWTPLGDGETINNMVTFAEANKAQAGTASAQALRGGGTSKYGEIVDLINSYMTDEEKGIYNYYVGKGDTGKANEYLSYITDILRQRQAGKIVEQVDDTALELVFSFGAGTQSGFQGLGNFVSGITGNEGASTSTLQYAHGMMSQGIEGDPQRQGNKGVWKAVNDLAYTTGNMTPSLLAGTIAGPVAGKAVGSIVTGISSAGNSYAEMIKQGYGVDQARKYGVMVGTAEGGLSYLFSGISSIGGKVTGNVISKAIDGIDSGIARFFVDFAISSSSEALEEGAQAILEPVFKMIATGEDFEGIDWSEVGYSAMLGGLSAGLLEGVPNAASAINTAYQSNVANGGLSIGGGIKAAFDPNMKLSEAFKKGQAVVTESAGYYANEALEIDPDNAHAQRMQSRISDGKNVSGYQINRIVDANQKTLTTQDKGKIRSAVETRLSELGETGNVSQIAEAITKKTTGQALTSADKQALSGSKQIVDNTRRTKPENNSEQKSRSTIADRVFNELQSKNIESGEYSSAWAESIGTDIVNADAYNRRQTPEINNISSTNTNASTDNNVPVRQPLTRSTSDVVVKTSDNKTTTSPIRSIEVKNNVASFKLDNGKSISADKAVFKTENHKAVADIAIDKMSRVEGFSNEAATAMIKGYDGNISPTQYDKVFTEAFKAGKEGASTSMVRQIASQNNDSESVVFAAYDIGREFSNSVLQSSRKSGTINIENTEATNESRQSIPVRESSKWLAGANPEGQVSRMEGSTGQIESRSEVRRYADSEVAGIADKGREVRVSDLGILGGSEHQKVRILDNVEETADMKEGREYAESRGLKVRYYAGDALTIETKRGTIEKVNAYILGNNVIVRATSPDFTSKQLVRHEVGHDMIAKGEVNIDEVRAKVKETFKSNEEVDQVAKYYEEAYSGSGLNADEIWEEVICDSLGDMNIFAKSNNWAEAAVHVGMTIPAIQQAVSETRVEVGQQAQKTTNTEVLYNNRDGNNGWGKVYTNTQEAVNAAVQSYDKKLYTAFANEFNNAVENGIAETPITNAFIAVQEDVRQDTITPIQGAKLLSEAYEKGGVKGLTSIYNHATGNLHAKALERAKQYSTSADEAMEGKASRDLYTLTNEYIREVTPDDRRRFNRSLADLTATMRDGEVRTFYIWATENVYVFRADGYMHGEMIRSYNGNDLQALEDFNNEYDRIDQDAETSAIWTEASENWKDQQRIDSVLYEGRRRPTSNDTLSAGASKSDRTGNTEREWTNPRTEEENREIVNKLREMMGMPLVDYGKQGKASRELDLDYMDAVNRGDMETAQRMVDEAAKKAGYTVRGLHATNAEFNSFDISKTSSENFHGKGIYFTNSVRDVENNYENYEGPDPWQKIEGRAYELVYDKYGISYEDTLTSDSEIIDKLNECYDIAIEEFKKSGRRITAYLRFDNPLILEKGMQIPNDYDGYDGIVDKQVYENIGHSGMDENTIHYVVFNPNNIKSADPVTYDDNGNVIPLSERFNPENEDIRYSRELDLDYDDSAEAGKTLTNRELLSNALESATTSQEELEKLREYKKNIQQLNKKSFVLEKLKEEIKQMSFGKGQRDTAKLAELKEKATKLERSLNYYDRQLVKLEAMKPVKDLLQRERSKAYKAAAEKGREALHRNIEGRHKSEARGKIKSLKQKFEHMIEHPSERQYVPKGLISAMVDVCDMIDTSSPLYKADGSINKAQLARNETRDRLIKLSDEYKKIKNDPDAMISQEYDEEISDYLDEIRQTYEGKNVSDMTLEELTELYRTMRSIDETLRDARKLIGWSDAESVYDTGDSIIAEQNAISGSRKNGKRSVAQKVDDSITNQSLSPMRATLKMAGYNEDSAMYQLMRDVEKGVRSKQKFVMDANKSFEKLTTGDNAKKYEDAIYQPYGKELVDKNGNKFNVSKMQMMQAVMSYDREIANDKLHHVSKGGFTFADLKLLSKGKLREAISAENAHTVTLGAELAVKFKAELSKDKWAQEYIATAKHFFDETAKNAVNETNLKLKHRIVATGKDYIPYEVNKDYVVREITSENDIQQVISSYGMLKDIKAGATQPLIITGLNNVLDRHIEQVGNIQGLAIPIRNFNKVWNVKASDGSTTVQEMIGKNWGDDGKKVITQAIKDVQGSRISKQSDLYKKLKGNVIGSTFILNGSVVSKQVGSMFAATSMLDYRDPASMVGNLIYTMANYDKIAAEVDKYTAAVWMRRQGLSDAEMHTLKTEAQKSKLGRFASKLPAVVNPAKWISAMDSSVALSLWKYAKQDVAKRTGLSGEELNRATAEYYEDVIEYTQSMTDALHRPEIQKSDNIASELLGMFKTDLYQGAGQLRVAAGQWAADKSSANSKKLAKTIASSISSICWGALMTSVWALIRYKVNPYRDEEDELTSESWLKIAGADVASEMIGYVVPLFGGEVAGSIFSIANGGSAEDLDSVSLTAVNELIDTIEKAAKYIKDGEMPSAKVYTNILAKFASVFGVPANNVIRLIDAIKLHAEDIANNEFLSFEAGLTSPNALRLYNAHIEGDADKIKKASRLYEDQKAIDSALRKQLRENDPRMKDAANAYIAGDYAKYNALRAEIVSEGIFSNTLVTDALKAEINYIKNKDKESE